MIAISKTPLIPMFPAQTLHAQSDGTFTVSVLAASGLRRENGTPCQDGDVLSCQPGGALQTRVSGTNGPYERCTLNGSYLTFNPAGLPYTFAYVGTLPNA